MKKLIFCAAAFATVLFAGSCQRENLEPVPNQTLTYTVALPDAAATKAASEELTLHYEVYRTVEQDVTEFTAADNLLYAKTATFNAAGVATLDLEVVNDQNFTVLFWAQHEGNGVYSWTDLTNVKVAQTLTANQTSYEAYAGVDCIKKGEELAGRKVTLTRPVAQLNIATTKASLESYFDDDITVNESYVKVTGKLATSFNVATLSPAAASDVEFKYESAAVPAGELKTGYKYVAMNYVAFVDADGENVVVDYILKTSEGNIDNTIGNVPVKPNYRTNIVGNLITASSDYTVTLNEWEDEIYGDTYIVTTDEELEEALKSDAEVINIILGADLNISPSAVIQMGTANAKKVIIDGTKNLTKASSAEGYTLNIETSYNAVVNTVNPEAVVVLKNLNLTSSLPSGTWDLYDILFESNVEIENVNMLKSIAFVGDNKTASLKNVTITESHDYYALWISACGVNVEWTGGVINSDGRGIKIDDQYIDSPLPTVLKVKGVDFNTKKKAAIMVKSKAATSIEVSDIDITGVAADPVNAVWVDEDAADCFDLVTVAGASKAQEGDSANLPVVVTTAEELQAAINASPSNAKETTVIYLKAGKYTGSFNVTGSRRVELMSNEKVTIDGLVHGDSGNYITLRGLTLTNATPGTSSTSRHQADGYCLGGYANCFHIEDCVFDIVKVGGINIYAAFNACEKEYELTVLNTTFNCNGQTPIRCKTNTFVDNCTFNDQRRYSMQFQANSQAATEKVVFTNNKVINPCVTSREPFAAGVQISHSQLCEDVAVTISGNTLTSELFTDLKFAYDHEESSASFGNIKITTCTLNGNLIVDGQCVEIDADTNEVLPEAAYTVEGNEYTILNESGLLWFANQVNVNENKFSGKTVKLAADINLENVAWTPVGQTYGTQFQGTFDGKNYTISNLNVDATADTREHYSSGLFGWLNAATVKNVKVDGATVKGNHNVGVIGGYLETAGCTIENCHVANATVECHVANSEANGDKCGVIVGHAGNAGVVVKDCTATESTVSAGRDAGQIVGAAKEANVTGCSATNVTVTANGNGTGANIRNEVIGRIL